MTDPRPTVSVRGAHVRYRVNEDRQTSFKELFSRGRVRSRVREVHAVRGVDLDVFEGETLGIVGTNGSGKSTLMSAMTGLLPLSAGEIHVRARPTLLGVSAALRPALSGRRNIIIGGLALGLSLDEILDRADDIASFAGLEEFIDLPMRAYSSGMRARLNFSIATARIPEILLIDEALAVGDEQFRRRSQERLDEIRANAGSVILVSHNLSEIETTCDRVIWLEKGELRLSGEPSEVVAAYLADLEPVEAESSIPAVSTGDADPDAEVRSDAESEPADELDATDGDGSVPTVQVHESIEEDGPSVEEKIDLSGRTAYVHIGLTDTGAAAFQRTLAKNQQQLAEIGIHYPRFLHQTNHTKLAAYANFDAASIIGIRDQEEWERWREDFRSDFLASTQVEGDLVLSSEFIGVGIRPRRITEVGQLLADAGYEHVEVLMVVRPQHEMAAIDHMTKVRNGRTERFDLEPHLDWGRRYDFELLASRWAAVDAVDAVHPILYPTRAGMAEPVEQMLSLIGAREAVPDQAEPDDARLGFGPGTVAYLRRLNLRLDPADLPIPADALSSLEAAEPPRLIRADAERLMARYAESNAALLDRVSEDRRVPGYFDLPRDEADPDADFGSDDAEAFAAAMVSYAADQRRRVRQQARDLG